MPRKRVTARERCHICGRKLSRNSLIEHKEERRSLYEYVLRNGEKRSLCVTCFHDIWELREFVKRCGGVVIAAHIFRSSGVGRKVFGLKEVFDALEVYPFNYDFDVYSLQIPLIAGSDSHTPYTVGFAYTYIPHSNCSADDIIQSIVKGEVLPVIRKPYTLRKFIDAPHILSFLMPSKPCML